MQNQAIEVIRRTIKDLKHSVLSPADVLLIEIALDQINDLGGVKEPDEFQPGEKLALWFEQSVLATSLGLSPLDCQIPGH
jgi:hypothetical protein